MGRDEEVSRGELSCLVVDKRQLRRDYDQRVEGELHEVSPMVKSSRWYRRIVVADRRVSVSMILEWLFLGKSIAAKLQVHDVDIHTVAPVR